MKIIKRKLQPDANLFLRQPLALFGYGLDFLSLGDTYESKPKQQPTTGQGLVGYPK
jgi:hypothetical protein